MSRAPAKLLTLSELGQLLGWDRRRTWRRVQAIHETRPGKWLLDVRGQYRVNISLLRREHPELFEAPDPEDLEGKQDDLSERVKVLEMRDRNKGAAITELRAEMREMLAVHEKIVVRTEAERSAMRRVVEAARRIKKHRAPYQHELQPVVDAIKDVDAEVAK